MSERDWPFWKWQLNAWQALTLVSLQSLAIAAVVLLVAQAITGRIFW